MKLIVIGSNSQGNAYALDAGSEILLLEAGIRHPLVSRAIGFRDDKVVGCCISHKHGDHAKYVEEYAKRGVRIFCNQDVRDAKRLPYGSFAILETLQRFKAGSFTIYPLPLHHDVPNFGYVIHHKDMGQLLFVTDTYTFDYYISDVDHFLMEANYADHILKYNVRNGKIDKAQADRLMLSHMEIKNSIRFLRESHAEKAKTITLCHLSERNSDPDEFRQRVSSKFGVPTYIAEKNLVVELSKQII